MYFHWLLSLQDCCCLAAANPLAEFSTLQLIRPRTVVEPLVVQLLWPVRAGPRHRKDSTGARLNWRSCRRQGPTGLEVEGRSVSRLPLSVILEAAVSCGSSLHLLRAACFMAVFILCHTSAVLSTLEEMIFFDCFWAVAGTCPGHFSVVGARLALKPF